MSVPEVSSPVYKFFAAVNLILDQFSLVLSAVGIFLTDDVTISAAAGSCGNSSVWRRRRWSTDG